MKKKVIDLEDVLNGGYHKMNKRKNECEILRISDTVCILLIFFADLNSQLD